MSSTLNMKTEHAAVKRIGPPSLLSEEIAAEKASNHAADKAQEWTVERLIKLITYEPDREDFEQASKAINAALAGKQEFWDACEAGYEAEIKQLREQLAAEREKHRREMESVTMNTSDIETVQQLREQLAACSVAQQPLVELLEEAHHRIGDTAFPSLSARIVNALAKVKEGK